MVFQISSWFPYDDSVLYYDAYQQHVSGSDAVECFKKCEDPKQENLIKDAIFPISSCYEFLCRFVELMPPNSLKNFQLSNKRMWNLSQRIRGIPVKDLTIFFDEDCEDIQVYNDKHDFFVQDSCRKEKHMLVADETLGKKLRISRSLLVKRLKSGNDKKAVKILNCLPKTFQDLVWDYSDNFEAVLDLIHPRLKSFFCKGYSELLDFDNFLPKMSNLSKIFVELEIDSEIKLTTPEIQAKIAKFCRTNPNLESFYFAFLDEKVYRRFHLNDKEIQCLEMTRNDEDGPGDDSEVDVEME